MKKILGLVSSFTVLMAVSCNSMNAPLVEASITGQAINVDITYNAEKDAYSTAVKYEYGSATFRVQPGAPQTQILGYEAQLFDEDNTVYTVATQGGLGAEASLPQGFVCPADKSTTGVETDNLYYCKPEDKAAKSTTRVVPLSGSLLPDITKKLTRECLESISGIKPNDGVCPNLKVRLTFTVKNLSTGSTFTVKAFPDLTNVAVKGSLKVE